MRSAWTSMPAIRAVPWVGAMNPVKSRIVVVLPAPLGPRKATTCPRGIEKVTSRTARNEPNCLREPLGLDHHGRGHAVAILAIPSRTVSRPRPTTRRKARRSRATRNGRNKNSRTPARSGRGASNGPIMHRLAPRRNNPLCLPSRQAPHRPTAVGSAPRAIEKVTTPPGTKPRTCRSRAGAEGNVPGRATQLRSTGLLI